MEPSEKPSVDLAIAGGAASAIHLLAELRERAKQGHSDLPRTIAILDPAIRPDGGTTHSDESPAFRVNMRVELHDVVGCLSFRDFLSRYGGSEVDPPLRADLGRYLSYAKTTVAQDLGALGYAVRFRRAAGTALLRQGRNYRMILDCGESVVARSVVIATGNAAPSRPPNVIVTDGNLDRVTYYAGGSAFARRIGAYDRTLVLGMGPGAIDVARHLIDGAGHKGPIDLASRSGMLSAVQACEPAPWEMREEVAKAVARLRELAERQKLGLGSVRDTFLPILLKYNPAIDFVQSSATPANALAHLAIQMAAAAQNGPLERQVLDVIGEFAPDIWGMLSNSARVEFKENWAALYYVKRTCRCRWVRLDG